MNGIADFVDGTRDSAPVNELLELDFVNGEVLELFADVDDLFQILELLLLVEHGGDVTSELNTVTSGGDSLFEVESKLLELIFGENTVDGMRGIGNRVDGSRDFAPVDELLELIIGGVEVLETTDADCSISRS